jgi:hypothetical protein
MTAAAYALQARHRPDPPAADGPSWNAGTVPLRLVPSPRPRQPTVADTARAVPAAHTDDGAGACRGCLNAYGHLKPAPCEQAAWATAVIDTAGSAS